MFQHASFKYYADSIRDMDTNVSTLPQSLHVAGDGRLDVYYAPFEYCNTGARLVICGLTPGMQQAVIAVNRARELLGEGLAETDILREVKGQASFAGAMRRNLVAMLDYIGLHKILEIDSCTALFSEAADLVHYTSALRLPVFSSGDNYRGSPLPTSHPMLRRMLDSFLVEEVKALGDQALWLPLGGAASDGLRYLVRKGILHPEQLLDGLPHPSGANSERIACFLDRKSAELLSSKTNSSAIYAARDSLVTKIAAYGKSQPDANDANDIYSSGCSVSSSSLADDQSRSVNISSDHTPYPAKQDQEGAGVASDDKICVFFRNGGLTMLDAEQRLHSTPLADTSDDVWVPVAKDQTIFSTGLEQKRGGYRIGAKGEERRVDDFSAALQALRAMAIPRWRRPSATSGRPGIVSAVGWVRVPRDTVNR